MNYEPPHKEIKFELALEERIRLRLRDNFHTQLKKKTVRNISDLKSSTIMVLYIATIGTK